MTASCPNRKTLKKRLDVRPTAVACPSTGRVTFVPAAIASIPQRKVRYAIFHRHCSFLRAYRILVDVNENGVVKEVDKVDKIMF